MHKSIEELGEQLTSVGAQFAYEIIEFPEVNNNILKVYEIHTLLSLEGAGIVKTTLKDDYSKKCVFWVNERVFESLTKEYTCIKYSVLMEVCGGSFLGIDKGRAYLCYKNLDKVNFN